MNKYKEDEQQETTQTFGAIQQRIRGGHQQGIRHETRTETSQCNASSRSGQLDSFIGESQRLDTASDKREIPAGAAGNSVAIALSELPNIPLIDKRHLPSCQCVYLACQGDHVLYVGQAVNLANRWKQHHHYLALKSMEDVCIAWVEISDSSLLLEIELALIEWFKPVLNKSINASSKRTSMYVKREKVDSMVVTVKVDAENLHQRIQKIRKERGLSQERLAFLSGMTIGNLQKIEQGYSKRLPFKTLKAICRALDYPIDKIIDIPQHLSLLGLSINKIIDTP